MPIKVSVVIPVYNPGKYIEDCIASLLRQSLPDDEYEAIFVNDGSTDGTPERLDRLAAEHANMHVIHQEASGWSGKPRNAGIAAAKGEFIQFVDNDDWLGDEALERMYNYGVENKADVIVGKMVGKGRGVPRELFRKNRPHANVDNAPLIDSLTPHKMFRKEFLDRHNSATWRGADVLRTTSSSPRRTYGPRTSRCSATTGATTTSSVRTRPTRDSSASTRSATSRTSARPWTSSSASPSPARCATASSAAGCAPRWSSGCAVSAC
jgi:glycosyltransferase involved in cell wall biosynthesis